MRHFLNLVDMPSGALRTIIDEARRRKEARQGWHKGRQDTDRPLDGRLAVLFFANPSTRTRLSFAAGLHQLGGSAMILSGAEAQWSRGETAEDTARIISGFADIMVARLDDHALIEAIAGAAKVPVINALTDGGHPCQILGDILTFEEQCGTIEGRVLAWSGDGNNVLCSWLEAAPAFGFTLHLAAPEQDLPQTALLEQGLKAGWLKLFDSAKAAAQGADCLMTDVWHSMSDKDEGVAQKKDRLMPFQITQEVMAAAKPEAIFMHCLPAHRGEEVAAEVIDGTQSRIFAEAENRLHSQKAILLWALDLLA